MFENVTTMYLIFHKLWIYNYQTSRTCCFKQVVTFFQNKNEKSFTTVPYCNYFIIVFRSVYLLAIVHFSVQIVRKSI